MRVFQVNDDKEEQGSQEAALPYTSHKVKVSGLTTVLVRGPEDVYICGRHAIHLDSVRDSAQYH